MNIFQKLESKHSKENSKEIIAYIGNDETRVQELLNCFFAQTKDYRVPQRAAHVVSILYDRNPDLIKPYIPQFIEKLKEPKLKGSLKRNILRILQHGNVPEDSKGFVYDLVFQWMMDPKEEIAVRAFACTVLYQISQDYFDLKYELKSALDLILEENPLAPGVLSRARKTRELLDRELDKF